MGFFKPKIYKHQGEAVALSLAWRIQDGPSGIKTSCSGMFAIGINWFITNQERTVESPINQDNIDYTTDYLLVQPMQETGQLPSS